jgi:hypothetical protein
MDKVITTRKTTINVRSDMDALIKKYQEDNKINSFSTALWELVRKGLKGGKL